MPLAFSDKTRYNGTAETNVKEKTRKEGLRRCTDSRTGCDRCRRPRSRSCWRYGPAGNPPPGGILTKNSAVKAGPRPRCSILRQRLDTLFGGDLAAAVRALVSESGCGQSELEQAMKVLEEKHLEAEEYDLYDPYG